MKTKEMFAVLVVPLVAMLLYLSLQGKGFPTLWPVAAATLYGVGQPFLQFFVFDRVREALVKAGQVRLYLGAIGLASSALAVGIAQAIT